jgi:hypothetical protein
LALEKASLGYTDKQITTAEMSAHLIELANWVRDAMQMDIGRLSMRLRDRTTIKSSESVHFTA